MLAVYNTILDNLNNDKKKSIEGQMSFFDIAGEDENRAGAHIHPGLLCQFGEEVVECLHSRLLQICMSKRKRGQTYRSREDRWFLGLREGKLAAAI